MFGTISASSLAQHNQLDAMLAEAVAEGKTIDGLLTDNPTASYARFVLVFDDAPATGTDYDRTFSFEGEEVARGQESVLFKVEERVENALASLAAESA